MPYSFSSSTSRTVSIGSTISMRSGPIPIVLMSDRSRRESRMLCCFPSWRMQTNPSITSLFVYSRTSPIIWTLPSVSHRQM